ncbi:unnamed protein product [Phaedon cochleariae]|uniref:Tetratricopeptide repeat protein 29 n=1 Tax=Phaedon cochleariae TaxID=80249 RepID=A0A9N9SCP8_PHACE|nr:unnamed protein product [Phaedon cochleariae]
MEDHLDDNYFKRERRRKEEINEYITKMRGDLPVYNVDEIRQYRLPYHEALLINLREQGFICTASFIQELFNFQEELRQQAGPVSHIWLRPQLIYSRAELDHLKQGLIKSEEYHMESDYAKECEVFLGLAVYFAFSHYDWWWLGEQLLIQSIKVSTEYESLKGKYEALSRFAYAKFLIENMKEFDDAKGHLKIAREIAQRKGWTSKGYFPDEKGTLFMQINHYLFECLYRNVKQLVKIDYKKAIPVIVEARRRAADACYHSGETRALVMKGICEMNIQDVKAAINSLLRAFQLQQRFGTQEGMCKVRIQLAKAYLIDGNTAMSLKTLMLLKESAETYNLPFYLGQAYKNLGEYYLTNGEPEKANPLLNEALKILNQCNLATRDIEMVRNLEAISAGLELFPKYIDLLHKAGTSDGDGFRNLMKLIDWKDQRTEFWNKDEIAPLSSLCDILTESMNKVVDSEEMMRGMSATKHPTVEEKDNQGIQDSKKIIPMSDGKEVIELHDNKGTFPIESTTGL